MNMAFVNSSYQLGGAETVVQDLVVGCRASGHATRMYVAAGKTYPRRSDVVPMYPRVLSRAYHSRFHSLVDRLAPRHAWTDQAFRVLADGWPDIVHVHNFHGDYATVASLAHVARHVPLVWTFHGHWGITGGCDHPLDCTRYQDACGECPRLGVWPLGAFDDTAENLQSKHALLGGLPIDVVAPSRFLAARIGASRVGRDWRIHHIPNGVCTATFNGKRKRDSGLRKRLGLDPRRISILVVNRSFRDVQKGFAMVREALESVAGHRCEAQVVLVGHDSEWAASELLPALAPLSMGYVNSRAAMAELFEAADIFLFASPAENLPCVILEAMASECCVVATPTSGVTEQIEDGATGILADRIDGHSLGRVLSTAVRNEHVRRSMGRAARGRALKEFSMETFVRRHLELYVSAR